MEKKFTHTKEEMLAIFIKIAYTKSEKRNMKRSSYNFKHDAEAFFKSVLDNQTYVSQEEMEEALDKAGYRKEISENYNLSPDRYYLSENKKLIKKIRSSI